MKKLLICITVLFGSINMYGQEIRLKGNWKFQIGDQQSWAKINFNDASWADIWVPSYWEERGYHGYDGYAWYRKSFEGNDLKSNEKYFLKLGNIDDVDEVYLNGQLIGFTGMMPPNYKTAFGTERNYLIPAGLLNYDEKNTIAVRVFDLTGAGGIVGNDIGIFPYRSVSPMLIQLAGVWRFSPSASSRPLTTSIWDLLRVPGYWEDQGYDNLDGFAWYKKTFTIDDDFNHDDLVLLLGQIDDFDEAYLNGKLIGRTNDRRAFLRSESHRSQRVYTIPKELLLKNKVNVIEVLVEDIGGAGGIYTGPVGITTRDLYNRYFR